MTFTIQEVDYGIACRIGDTILINRKIKSFSPLLFDALLKHELEHTSKFTTKDFNLDIINGQLRDKKKEYYTFILKHPSSWIEFLPIQFYKGKIVLSPALCALYLLFFSIFIWGWLWN